MSEDHPGTSTSRRRRSIVTLGVVLLLLFFAVWYAMSYIRADDERRGTARTSSATATSCTLSPEEVTVNVYNATTRDGLAGKVASDLSKRGFVVKTVANDPKKAEVSGVGQIRHGASGEAVAKLVQRHVAGATLVEDKRKRTLVDVVIGPEYTSLTPKGKLPAGC